MPRRLMCLLALVSLATPSAGPAFAGTDPEGIVVVPVAAPDSPNLAGLGQLSLVIVSTDKVDASRIDAETVTLNGKEVGVARWQGGQPLAVVTDVDANGRSDLRLFFDKQATRVAGVLTAATKELTVSGLLPDGRTFTGSGAVTPACCSRSSSKSIWGYGVQRRPCTALAAST